LPGIDQILSGRRNSVVAISPIIGGKALKGPADRMLSELGLEPSVVGIARLYAPIAGTLVIDQVDQALVSAVENEGIRCVVESTMMSTPDVAQGLAATCLELA
jgi:LPPG:FO 2-phospho-L-lactate transferase